MWKAMSRRLAKLISRFLRPTVQLGKKDNVQRLSWLQDARSDVVQKYINKENRYTNLMLMQTKKFQKNILKAFEEFHSHCQNETAYEEECGSYIYYEKSCNGALSSIYRKHVENGEEFLVLNQNDIAKDTGYIQLYALKPSPSGQYLAAILRTNKVSEIGSCYVYALQRHGPKLLEILPRVARAEWCNDDKNIIFGISNKVGAVSRIERFCINDMSMHHMLTENDPRFTLDLLKTRDNKFIIAHSNSKTCTEVHIIDSDNHGQGFRCLVKRENEIECFVDHWDDHFYALKNTRDDSDYLVAKKKGIEDDSDWETIYPTGNKSNILDMELFSDRLVLYELRNLIPQLTSISLDGTKRLHTLKPIDHPAIIESFSNQDPHSQTVGYSVTSPIEPLKIYEYDSSKSTRRIRSNMLPNWKQSDFQCKIIENKSKDGANIPTTIFFKRGMKDLKNSPAFIKVYGSYGEPADLRFSAETAFLLKNGWIIAYPHVRGGGEFGRKWHKQATKRNKRKTFQDLQASVKGFHEMGYSKPDKTAVYGMSAGGMAVAVLCNESPELLNAAILKVPFLDVQNSMLEQEHNLTAQEFEEWGDPRTSEEDLANLNSYCPLQNLKGSKNFPNAFLTSYENDERVPVWVALKWLAKWRHISHLEREIDSLVLCRIYDRGGHFGYSKLQLEYQACEMIAFLYLSLGLEMDVKNT